MATITKSIGTSSRDYSTITAWEADLDNGAVYAAGDVALGECYNDSAFDEAFTINGGNTIGLTEVRLSVASGQRHTGTAGTGARITASVARTIALNTPATSFNNKYTIEWLELNSNGFSAFIQTNGSAASTIGRLRWMLIHDMTATTGTSTFVGGNRDMTFTNNIVYDYQRNATSTVRMVDYLGSVSGGGCCNNTIYKGRNNSTGAINGLEIATNSANALVKNNIAMLMESTSSAVKSDFIFPGTTVTDACNMSSDVTGDDGGGSGNLISKSSTTQFVSTTNGSEDLHLVVGSDAINVGEDLVTTPSGVNFDIDNRDRDALNDVWDIGADEYVSLAKAPPIWRRPTRFWTKRF